MSQPSLDFTRFNTTIHPGDDLFRHVNGGWLVDAKIPEDKSAIGAFDDLHDDSVEAIKVICENLSGRTYDDYSTEDAKLAALYLSFMNEERLEELGASPLTALLAKVEAIATIDDLRDWMGWCILHGLNSLTGGDVDADPGNPRRHLFFVGQGGLGLPEQSYYTEPQHEEVRAHYLTYIARTLGLGAGRDTPTEQDHSDAQGVFDLESHIAVTHWDNVKTRDLAQMYNLRTTEELAGEAPGFGWERILAGAGLTNDVAEVVNCQPSFFVDVSTLLTEDRLPVWKTWARFHLISDLSDFLSKVFVDNHFDFYGRILTGQERLKPRWKRAVAFTEAAMGEALGKVYVRKYYPPEAAARMATLIENLLGAYRQSITDLTWMGEETKVEALRKLDGFRPKIGHPPKWRDYSALVVNPDDLVGNVLAEGRFTTEYEVSKLSVPVDPDEWMMFPQTVNAYYHPLRNEIVFPAAILQPPFFNLHGDDAVNYGGIGAVIGHEIGHGFDDQGSTCDGEGKLRDWWTPEDREAFTTATQALIDQYSALSPAQLPDQHVNGELTIGENIGDLGGLGIALKAWRLAGGDPDEVIDGYTCLQRFFLSWAASWSYHARKELVAQRLATDEHAPPEFRCNQVVRNIDEFYTAFDVGPDDALWLPPEDRVTIW
ncbi:MAG: peptidase M13 [Propionibacteriaceae bacterium]|nr:peptidase M13 [Propionibacteriaceae bacterium]